MTQPIEIETRIGAPPEVVFAYFVDPELYRRWKGTTAELDSRPVPAGELLVAESDDEMVAALSVETGARVADPFRHTADVVDLLAYRAKGLRT